MGLRLGFYTGDPDIIGPAIANADFDALEVDGVVQAYADLSLHIIPKDLDILTLEAAAMLQRPPILLRECLGEVIGGDESDHGAFLVGHDWVAQIAELYRQSANELCTRWMAAMAQQYDDPEICSTPPAVAAVSALIDLCRHAVGTSSPVIHAWFK